MEIPKQIQEKIKEYTYWNEYERKLHLSLLEVIYEEEWFKILMPKDVGGGEWPLYKAVTLFENLARLDANVGWAVNLGAGANMFAGYFKKEVSEEIFNCKEVVCAGSGSVLGYAVQQGDDYIVRGTWKYASGAAHATHFTANCWILDENNQAVVDEDGNPTFKSFIFDRKDVMVHDTWHAMGLKATSSHDFSVQKLKVSKNHTFNLLKPSAIAKGTLYQFPFATMAVINMSSMLIGIAYSFFDEFEKLMETKKPLNANKRLKEEDFVVSEYQKYSSVFKTTHELATLNLKEIWSQLESGDRPSVEAFTALEIAYHEVTQHAYEMVVRLYPLFGMTIVFKANRVNKIFRDFMTASQHYQMHPIQLYNKKEELAKSSLSE